MLFYGKVFLFALKRWEDDIKRMKQWVVVCVRVTRRVCLADAKRFMMVRLERVTMTARSNEVHPGRRKCWRDTQRRRLLGVGLRKTDLGYGHIGIHRIDLSIIHKVKLVAVDSQLHSGFWRFILVLNGIFDEPMKGTSNVLLASVLLCLQQRFHGIFFEKRLDWSTSCLFFANNPVIEHHSMHWALCKRPPPTVPNENECWNRFLLSLLYPKRGLIQIIEDAKSCMRMQLWRSTIKSTISFSGNYIRWLDSHTRKCQIRSFYHLIWKHMLIFVHLPSLCKERRVFFFVCSNILVSDFLKKCWIQHYPD